MIRHTKNYKIFLTKTFICFAICILVSCSLNTSKKIFWYDLREKKEKSKVVLEFRSKKGIDKNIVYSNKTEKIILNNDSELFTVEHDSSFCTKISSTKKGIEIFVFPTNYIKSDEDFLYLPENGSIYAYFVECFDSKLNRNYYIFSNDNKIDIHAKFEADDFNILKLEKLDERDFAVYNGDFQILTEPYAGYVVKNSEGEFIMLSTLWDSNSF